MKATPIKLDRLLTNSPFWLLSIASGLVAIYMTALWKSDDVAQLTMSALFLLAVSSLIWDKRHTLNLESEIIPTIIGISIIGVVLLNSTTLPMPNTKHADPFWRLYPFISGLGFSLIASGFKGLKQYWRELTILFFAGGPSVLISLLIELSEPTAKFSSFMLWYLGFDLVRQGVYIIFPTGSVVVRDACSGLDSVSYALALAVLCLLMFPTNKRSHIIIVPIVGIIIGFVVNASRVALMAVMVVSSQMETFKYLHEGDASLIFGMISVVCLGCFYMFLMKLDENQNPESEK